MELTIEVGEMLWNPDGTHLLDVDGIVVVAAEQTIILFSSQEAYDNAVAARADAEQRSNPK